jgi:glycosyltransferase involved in cell wall biosynthesis
VKISVITVCKNEEAKIATTAESVCKQSFNDFEWIVIDGLSSDKTVEVLRPYLPKASSFTSESDLGCYYAMNKGARLAKGQYLLFLNGGDMLVEPHVLEECFSRPWTADILIGDLIITRQDGTRNILRCTKEMLKPQHLWTASYPHPSTFIRRDLFIKLGGYDESFTIAADYEFFARAVLQFCASVELLKKEVSIFRTGGVSTIDNMKTKRDKESQLVRRRHVKTWDVLKAKLWPIIHTDHGES